MKTVLAASVLVLLSGGVVAAPEPPKIDAGAFVQKAVENGLTENGVPPELAAELAKRDDDFVKKCEICQPTRMALRAHAKRTDVPAAKEAMPE
ncbi:MAG: hypothetical protein K2V38_09045, partial [Gemmataceae bacterium]|nr:hypothetical protein [Gemmataceae bacterium]